MKRSVLDIFNRLFVRRPELDFDDFRVGFLSAFDFLCESFRRGGVLYICGNGGSAADSEHIVGELMKSFKKKRPVSDDIRCDFVEKFGSAGDLLADSLECGLPAISLCSGLALNTAVLNDSDPVNIYAQRLFNLCKRGDCLVVLSTSGNAENCIRAAMVAQSKGLRVISITGMSGGRIKDFSDVNIAVPATETFAVQELHLPVYHCLCAMLEEEFF